MALSTTTVKVSEVKTALGTTKNSVLDLCKNNLEAGKSINKWSAHKPFQNSTTYFSYNDLTNALQTANYGLRVVAKTLSSALSDCNPSSANYSSLWEYLKPDGTSSKPCRLGDFRGYENSAPIPYSSSVTVTDGVVNTNQYNGSDASYSFTLQQASNADIKVKDMTIKSGTWGVIVKKDSGAAQWVTANISAESILTNDQIDVENTIAGHTTIATYNMQMCAAVKVGTSYYPIPNTFQQFTVRVKSRIEAAGVAYDFESYYEVIGRTVNVYSNITFTNLRTTTSTVSSYSVVIDDSAGNGHTFQSSTSRTITGNGSLTINIGTTTATKTIGGVTSVWGKFSYTIGEYDQPSSSDFSVSGTYTANTYPITIEGMVDDINSQNI